MNAESAEYRLQAVRTRRLECKAILAGWKRDWLVSGVSHSLAERATLEAEIAELDLEERQIGHAAVNAKALRKRLEQASVLAALQRILAERGMSALLAEAEARAAAAQAEAMSEVSEGAAA